jgi:hypothetical protein
MFGPKNIRRILLGKYVEVCFFLLIMTAQMKNLRNQPEKTSSKKTKKNIRKNFKVFFIICKIFAFKYDCTLTLKASIKLFQASQQTGIPPN